MNRIISCIFFVFIVLPTHDILGQNVTKISGGDYSSNIKENIITVKTEGNFAYFLFSKTINNRLVKGFKVNYSLYRFPINQNKSQVNLKKPMLKFSLPYGGFSTFSLQNDQITFFGNFSERSHIKTFNLSGNVTKEIEIAKSKCNLIDFIGFINSGLLVFKDWCGQKIDILKETKEVHSTYQLEDKDLYHNIELIDDRLCSYRTLKDSTSLSLELVEFDITNENTIKKTFKPTHRTPTTKSKGFKKYGTKFILTESDSINQYHRVFTINNDTMLQENSIVIPHKKSLDLIGMENNTLLFHHSIIEYEDLGNGFSQPKVFERNLVLIKSSRDIDNLTQGVNLFKLPLENVSSHHIISNNGSVHILTKYAKTSKKLGLKTITL